MWLLPLLQHSELMETMGIARAVHVAEGCHGYVLVTPGHTHHLACERCRTVLLWRSWAASWIIFWKSSRSIRAIP